MKKEPIHGCIVLGSNCPRMQPCIGSACNIACAEAEVKIQSMRSISRPDARERSVSASGPSDFALNDKGERGISRSGATFFARGGKEGKTPLEPLRFKTPAKRKSLQFRYNRF